MPHPAFQAVAHGAVPALLFGVRFLNDIPAVFERGLALLAAGYQRAPVLVMVLPALLVVPLAAGVSLAVRRVARAKDRRAAEQRLRRAGEAVADSTKPAISGTTIPASLSQAWLTVDGRSNGTVRLSGQLIRIGRNEDNDVRLTDRSVHRYHAVIERTPEETFVITDLSGTAGNGIRINGERSAKAHLADGDVIELGRAKLKFENAPV